MATGPYPQNAGFSQATGTTLLAGTKAVNDTAVQLVASATAAKSVVVQARSDNGGTVTIGADNTITSLGAGVTLAAGESISIAIDDLSKVWLVGSAAGQNVDYLGVR